ncbi:hypothetical protein IQ269_24480 [Tychonema sp. LEGE 07199]|uniref:hypothetical protein n=1 Tax=unclassified Tychonema TaxID=2642144 RepID=UPI0018825009|nr:MULTISPECIES: hypothetical protein [unclassified Tychonema]MBE9123869.1 hypothetical protein [Tychonema sp. LEGE 07199]MBE9135187.1 hypothetical protein [Tychonema sp. LEGE 07196]
MPKERDYLVFWVDRRHGSCKHLYSAMLFGIVESTIGSIARQTSEIGGRILIPTQERWELEMEIGL